MTIRSFFTKNRPDQAVDLPAPQSAGQMVGEALRQGREDKGVDLATAALDLKIREDYLAALEADNPDALPGLPYAAGFIRSYARYVGLDAENLVECYRGDSEKLNVSTEFAWLTPIQEGRFSGGLVFVVSLLLAGVPMPAGTIRRKKTGSRRWPPIQPRRRIRRRSSLRSPALPGKVCVAVRIAAVPRREAARAQGPARLPTGAPAARPGAGPMTDRRLNRTLMPGPSRWMSAWAKTGRPKRRRSQFDKRSC